MSPMKRNAALFEKLVAHVNRKAWWHVPPRDATAYSKRGKFFASSFSEAEFWGRPLDAPQKVVVKRPLVGDEDTIERALLGHRVSYEDIDVEERWDTDAKMRGAALAKGYDSIVLMTSKAYAKFKASGTLPRSMELNVLNADERDGLAGTSKSF